MFQDVGRHHALVRRYRALRRDSRLRRDEGVLLAEGPRLAREALDRGAALELVIVTAALERDATNRRLIEALAGSGATCVRVSDAVMDSLQDARSPQPVACVARRPHWSDRTWLDSAGPEPLVVVVDGVQDPGNLGGILRTANAAGASGCLACGDGADPFHPRAVRASAGAVFRLPIMQGSRDWALERVTSQGLTTVGAAAAEGAAFERFDFRRGVALWLGAEGRGLDAQLLSRLDGRLHVPMAAGVESLSVGAAAAVVLFEAARQRRRLSRPDDPGG